MQPAHSGLWAQSARHLAFRDLTLKVCFLPILLVNLFDVVMTGRQLSFRPNSLLLGLAIIIASAVLSCALMVVSSYYRLAAIVRARNKQLVSPETAKKYKRWHAIPIANMLSSISLYILLHRLNSAAPTNAQDAYPAVTAEVTPSTKVPYTTTQCPKNMSSSSKYAENGPSGFKAILVRSNRCAKPSSVIF